MCGFQVGPVYSISGKGTYAVNEETTARAAAKFGWTGTARVL